MKILLTGASSFTGMWFAKELADQGHQVIAPLKRALKDYSGVRKQRVEKVATVIESCPLGSDAFFSLIDKMGPWDLFCHHAAEVTNYKSPDFDTLKAVANNTYRSEAILSTLSTKGCRHLLLTGSVFEQREGAGSKEAVSPYGLSKGITSDLFEYQTKKCGWTMGKFVIPNPFGPYEEERFTAFLMREWFEGKEAPITYPSYVRDNIHVSLLAKGYAAFANTLVATDAPFIKLNPSGYIEEQGAFTERFAAAMRPQLKLPCRYTLLEQTEFLEPIKRYNTDPLDGEQLGWSEEEAWEGIANYYKEKYCQV